MPSANDAGVALATARYARADGATLDRARVLVAELRAARPEAKAGHGSRATCDGRVPTILGTDGPDVIKGTPGRDVIAGLGGDDQIGGGQNDIICGGDGNDRLNGGSGNDTLFGEGGDNDFLDGGPGNDMMDAGGSRFDAIVFFDATGPVTASLATGTATGQGTDTFTGANELHGGQGDDTFH